MRTFLVAVVCACAVGLHIEAEQPDFGSLSSSLFVLKADTPDVSWTAHEGIYRIDLGNGALERAAPFVFRTATYPTGKTHLTSVEDRLIVQGADNYEFDLASGRFLRRYKALDNAFDGWLFSGFGIGPKHAAALSMSAGYYGALECPQAIGGYGCRPVAVAGYDDASQRRDLLLSRSLQPGERTLTVFAQLFASVPDERLYAVRTAPDPDRGGLWVWRENGVTSDSQTVRQRIMFVTLDLRGIRQGTTIRDVTWDARTDAPFNSIVDLAYAPSERSLFALTKDIRTYDRKLSRVSTDSGSENILLAGSESNLKSVTTVGGELPDTYSQIIPAIGHAAGVNGTLWRSDLWLFNPSDDIVAVSIRRVTRPDVSVRYDLASHSSREIADVLRAVGGGPASDGGDGVTTDALVITSSYRWGAQVVAAARTWTPATNGGTYGQAVPAVPGNSGYSNHEPTFTDTDDTIAGHSIFVMDKRVNAQFRHNIGFVNDSGESLTVRLRYAISAPNDVPAPYQQSYEVPPHSVGTANLESLFPSDFAATRPSRIWVTADRPVPVWMSMVDNKTGDGTFVPYTLFELKGSNETFIALPAVVNAPGANGTLWRTDVYGYFLPIDTPDSEESPLAVYRPADKSPCQSRRLTGVAGWTSDSTVENYWTSIYPNVAAQFAGCSPIGSLTLRSASWVAAIARTYTQREDGGTYGEMLPFYPPEGWPVQHFAGVKLTDDFRVNIGLYNALSYSVDNQILVYDDAGALVANRTIRVDPGQSLQLALTSLFPPTPAKGVFGVSVVPKDTPNGPGRSWAYISVIDNHTGDPTNFW
jgi:hypothetical protein